MTPNRSLRSAAGALLALLGLVGLGLVSGATAGRAAPAARRALPLADAVAGITVEGTGRASLRATALVVRMRAQAEAPGAEDAQAQLVDFRRRTTAAFAALDASAHGAGELALEPQGARVVWVEGMDAEANGMFMGRGQAVPTESVVRYREEYRLRVDGADALDADAREALVATIVDTALDLGLQLPQGARVQNYYGQEAPYPGEVFELLLPERAAVEREAYRAAMDAARRRALDLAEAGGVGLGAPASVTVLSVTERWETALAEHECEARLRVVFGIE